MLAILILAAEKHKATFIAPVGIGIALFVAEMWGVGYTGGSLNPARTFGPSVADGSFNGYGDALSCYSGCILLYSSQIRRQLPFQPHR
jgi:glycerol uptake facilitator-like aquaporin